MLKKSTTKKTKFSVNCSITHKEKFKKLCNLENRNQTSMFENMIDSYKPTKK